MLASCTAPVMGAFSIVAHTVAVSSAGGGSVTTTGINTTGANLIVLVISTYASFGAGTVTDAVGGCGTIGSSSCNTWIQASIGSVSDIRGQIFYCYGCTVGSGHQFEVNGVTNYPGIAVIALSGATGTNPLDVQSDNTAGSSPVAPGSVTPGSINEILITGFSPNEAFSSLAVGSSFTIEDQGAYNAGNGFGVASGYLIQTSAAVENPSWTFSSGTITGVVATIASFKAASGGGTPYTAATADGVLVSNSAAGSSAHVGTSRESGLVSYGTAQLGAHHSATADAGLVVASTAGLGTHSAAVADSGLVASIAIGSGSHVSGTAELILGSSGQFGLAAHYGSTLELGLASYSTQGLQGRGALASETLLSVTGAQGLGAHVGGASELLASLNVDRPSDSAGRSAATSDAALVSYSTSQANGHGAIVSDSPLVSSFVSSTASHYGIGSEGLFVGAVSTGLGAHAGSVKEVLVSLVPYTTAAGAAHYATPYDTGQVALVVQGMGAHYAAISEGMPIIVDHGIPSKSNFGSSSETLISLGMAIGHGAHGASPMDGDLVSDIGTYPHGQSAVGREFLYILGSVAVSAQVGIVVSPGHLGVLPTRNGTGQYPPTTFIWTVPLP